MKILLIIDMQNDFCPGGSLAVTDGDKIIPIINKLMLQGEYDHIFASKDWHPENHSSFKEWPAHCVQNTLGAEFMRGLKTDLIEKIFLKGTDPNIDSYSAVIDNLKIQSTGLIEHITDLLDKHSELKEQSEIHVVGLALDYCVKYTALDIVKNGFNVSVVYDATKPVNLDAGDLDTLRLSDEQKAISELTNAGVQIVTSNNILIPDIKQNAQIKPAHKEIQLSV